MQEYGSTGVQLKKVHSTKLPLTIDSVRKTNMFIKDSGQKAKEQISGMMLDQYQFIDKERESPMLKVSANQKKRLKYNMNEAVNV